MGGDRNDAPVGSDERVDVVRVAADHVGGREPPQERRLEDAHARRHVPRGPVGVVFERPPFGIFLVQDPSSQMGSEAMLIWMK
jgi:hypothetical protein